MAGNADGSKRTSLRAKGKHSWRYALAGLGIIALLTAGAVGYCLLQGPQPTKIILLVAELEGAGAQKDLVKVMTRNLCAALAPYREVKVVTLGRAITEAQGSATARAEGAKRKATIVVWGSYNPDQAITSLSLHFEILKLPKGVPEPTLTQSLVVQARSSARMTIPTLFAAGMARYVAEDWDGALAAFGGILTLSAEQPTDSVLSLAYALIADAYYARGDFTQAIASYDQALIVRPDVAETLVRRGMAYGAQGDYDRAISDFDQAIALKRDLAEAYYNSGNAYYAKRELELAIANYDQAIAEKPDYAEAYCNRGLAYASDGDYERAIRDLDQAVQLKPDFVRAYSNRGSVRYARREYGQAIADYDRVITLKPDFAEAYYNRGATYMAQGEREKAVKDLEKFLELSTDPSWRQLAQQKLDELGAQ